MKKKYIALMLGITLAFSSLTGTAALAAAKSTEASKEAGKKADEKKIAADKGKDQEQDTEKEQESTVLYGQVKEVTSDGITIAAGTVKQEEAETEAGNEGRKDTAADKEKKTEDVSEADGKKTAPSKKESSSADGASSDLTEEIIIQLDGTEAKVAVGKDVTILSQVLDAEPQEGTSARTEEASGEEARADKEEKVELKELKAGDFVKLTYGADNKLEEITILARAKAELTEDSTADDAETEVTEDGTAGNAETEEGQVR